MAQPIYKLWQGRFTEAWHDLSDQEKQRLMGELPEALTAVGASALVVCTAAWSNERWPYFGLEQYPDLEAVQRHDEMLGELNWPRYMESRSTLGTELTLPVQD